MNKSHLFLLFLVVAVAGAAACSPRHRPFAWADSQPEPPYFDGGDGCFDDGNRISLCSWVTSHDALVVGEITSVQSSWSPMYTNVIGEPSLVSDPDTCVTLDPALLLSVDVLEVEWGEDVPASLRVRIGAKHVEEWGYGLTSPFPSEEAAFANPDVALDLGDAVVLPIFAMPGEDVFAIVTAFPVVRNGEVLFPHYGCGPLDLQFNHQDVDAFLSDADNCLWRDGRANEERESIVQNDIDTEAYVTMARCTPQQPAEPECINDLDCPTETPSCFENRCRSTG